MKIANFVCNPFAENTYVVYDEASREAAIIDCGCYTESEEQRLADFISLNNLNVKYLLNTHLHLDHVFGNRWAAAEFGVQPLAHRADEVLLENFERQCALFGIPAADGAQALGGYLDENDTLNIGGEEFQILHVPGHSPGSLCFYSAHAKAVFVGDVLFQQSIGRTDLQGGCYEQLIEGIEQKLFTLPDETVVYSGHGPATQIGFEKQNNPYI